MSAQSVVKFALANVSALLFAALVVVAPAQASEGSAERTVAASALPAQAQETRRLIFAGGPFPYAKDGSVFANRERRLPMRSRGYYREYTVDTPGLKHRGARRIVCGGQQPTAPDTCYYSADHYASFRRIEQ